ncbi:hypothetical protein N836_29965 [Leptolyngbya sp. Heron Island J]|uniref:hypothetical protein n=1 Tax=Leptolyngbya sp. Heron Island J TaxID=1385935 RepID=UPI0003B96ADF|nr:hypothetical protein [Leptolyngbya sp. Heron Island J]ESA38755.1 hypothetical protein N836_29965 [Leptolyngbya sp. Heron Island J]
MKIVQLIGNFRSNTGKGGHYYSCLSIAEELSKNHKVRIVSVGKEQPSIYKGNQLCFHQFGEVENLDSIVEKLHSQLQEIVPDILHAYDPKSGYIASHLNHKYGYPYIVTKPGGACLPPSVPLYPAMIAFHREDLDDFSKRLDYPKKVWMLPHRAKPLTRRLLNRESVFQNVAKNCLRVLRIGSITARYEGALLQAINITQLLNSRGLSSSLAIVGYVESEAVLNRLRNVAGQETSFYISEDATISASDYILDADVVVGTGRSVVDGLSARKIILVPVKGSKYPALLNEAKFSHFFDKNFSLRAEKSSFISPDKQTEEIITTLSQTAKKEILEEWCWKIFTENFDVKEGVIKLLDIYHEISLNKNIVGVEQLEKLDRFYRRRNFEEKYVVGIKKKIKHILSYSRLDSLFL